MSEPNDDTRARDLADALCEWVGTLTDGLDLSAGAGVAKTLAPLPFIGPEAPALPFVVAELLSMDSAAAGDDQRFPRDSIQQADLLVYVFEVVLVVDWKRPGDADELVKTLASRMRRSLWADGTLGGRVQATSRDFRAEFDEPLIKWESGEIGRQAVVTILVGDRLQDPTTEGKWW